jgi:hypothetical protein
MCLLVFLKMLSEWKYTEPKEYNKNVFILRSYLRLFINSWANYIKHKEMSQTCSIHAKGLGKICNTIFRLYICNECNDPVRKLRQH